MRYIELSDGRVVSPEQFRCEKASSQKIENKRGDLVWDAKEREKDYISHGASYRSNARPEVIEALKAVVEASFWRSVEVTDDVSTQEKISKRQVENLDKRIDSLRAELAREALYGKKKAPATAEHLAEFDKAAAEIRAGRAGEMVELPNSARGRLTVPPIAPEQVATLARIYKEVRGRQAYGKVQSGHWRGAAMDIANAITVKEQAEQRLTDAKEEKVKRKRTKTEYLSEAWKLDVGRDGGYWASNHEMTARAFEAWVYDRLKDTDARNDFLAYEKRNDLPEYQLFGVKPYPEGQERKDINAAFDKLFTALETQESDGGAVMLYQAERPIKELRGDELGKDLAVGELRSAAQRWYRNNLIGQRAETKDGWLVSFSSRGMRKSTAKGEGLLRLIPAIKDVIERGSLVESRPGRDTGTKAMHFISGIVGLDGQAQSVVVAVRETADGKYQYDFTWDENDQARPFRAEGDRAQERLSPVWNQPDLTINIGSSPSSGKAKPRYAMRQDTKSILWPALPDLRAELDRLGLERVDLQLAEPDVVYQGALRIDRKGGMTVLLGASVDPMATLRHEAIHALRAMNVLGEGEWKILTARAEKNWLAKHDIKKRYPDLDRSQQIEEAIAEEYAAWAASDRPARSGAFERIRRFLEALRNVLAGRGFKTIDDVFAEVSSGAVGVRRGDRSSAAPGQLTQVATAPSTDSPAFKRWFGDSKVVDENGEPLVVYHGTRSDIEAFDAGADVANGTRSGAGFYFTPSQRRASSYSNGRGGNVVPAYLSVQNPFMGFDTLTDEQRQTYLNAEGDINETLRAMGFDGRMDQGSAEIVAFDPTQIKSVNNRGTFDPDDARILYQRPALKREVRERKADAANAPIIPDRRVFDEAVRRNGGALTRAAGAKGAVRDRVDDARVLLQDRMLPLRRAEEAIEAATGQAVRKKDSVYFAEERYSGRTGARLDAIQDQYVSPTAKLIAKAPGGLKLTDPDGKVRTGADAADLYLWARHAKERNAQIAQINPGLGGPTLEDPYATGSGSADHVQMFVSVPPKLAVSDLVRLMKGRSSHKVQREFPQLKKRNGGRGFRGRGYFSTTNDAITEDIVLQYLEQHIQNPTGASR